MGALKKTKELYSEAEKSINQAGDSRDYGFANANNTYAPVRDEYKPYMETGKIANTALQKLFTNPNSIMSDPGYLFRKQQGEDSIQNSAAAKGGLFGGNTLMSLIKFGSDYASSELDKAVARYSGGVQVGMNATKGYDDASLNLADLQAGQGQANAKRYEDMASLQGTAAKSTWHMFESWWGGSGPFGQATGSTLGKSSGGGGGGGGAE